MPRESAEVMDFLSNPCNPMLRSIKETTSTGFLWLPNTHNLKHKFVKSVKCQSVIVTWIKNLKYTFASDLMLSVLCLFLSQ